MQCGTLRVPVDWKRPSGRTFGLAVARRPAADPAARIGALVINPGGPGGSGISLAIVADTVFSREILTRFDIVGFDPRGFHRSESARCSTELPEGAPFAIPGDEREFARRVADNRQRHADCRRHTGPLLEHMDTLSVARDVEALRVALGEAKLNYFGVSYGTQIGLQYAELFGGRIRAMALDSVLDHSIGLDRRLQTEAAAMEDALLQFTG